MVKKKTSKNARSKGILPIGRFEATAWQVIVVITEPTFFKVLNLISLQCTKKNLDTFGSSDDKTRISVVNQSF